MLNFVRAGVISVALLGVTAAASAAGLADMVGTWKWTDYTVECKAGGANGMSCLVIDGPKNKGLEMVQSPLTAQGDAFVGDIKHPASGDLYKAKMTFKDGTWTMDGCTAAGVCASGVFTKVK